MLGRPPARRATSARQLMLFNPEQGALAGLPRVRVLRSLGTLSMAGSGVTLSVTTTGLYRAYPAAYRALRTSAAATQSTI